MTRDDLGPTWRWIVGVLLTVLMALIANTVRDNTVAVAEATTTNAQQDREIAAIKASADLRGAQLDRIEMKVEKLLERTIK